LSWRDEAIESAGLAYDRRDLGSSFCQHANFVLPKDSGFDRLDDEGALQNPSIDEWNTEK